MAPIDFLSFNELNRNQNKIDLNGRKFANIDRLFRFAEMMIMKRAKKKKTF